MKENTQAWLLINDWLSLKLENIVSVILLAFCYVTHKKSHYGNS